MEVYMHMYYMYTFIYVYIYIHCIYKQISVISKCPYLNLAIPVALRSCICIANQKIGKAYVKTILFIRDCFDDTHLVSQVIDFQRHVHIYYIKCHPG